METEFDYTPHKIAVKDTVLALDDNDALMGVAQALLHDAHMTAFDGIGDTMEEIMDDINRAARLQALSQAAFMRRRAVMETRAELEKPAILSALYSTVMAHSKRQTIERNMSALHNLGDKIHATRNEIIRDEQVAADLEVIKKILLDKGFQGELDDLIGKAETILRSGAKTRGNPGASNRQISALLESLGLAPFPSLRIVSDSEDE
jgi:hypothetical protein